MTFTGNGVMVSQTLRQKVREVFQVHFASEHIAKIKGEKEERVCVISLYQ